MKGWLVIGILISMALAPVMGATPSRTGLRPEGSSPVSQWASGDWWEVQLEQQSIQARAGEEGWTPSFRLHFSVTRTEREVRVEVTTVPENRFQERLVLRYTLEGELLSAQIVAPDRVTTLAPGSGFGVFGMLGREAFVLSQAPAKTRRDARPVRVRVDGTRGAVQTWHPGDAWWTRFESDDGLPQRATLVDASWRHSAVGEGHLRSE